MKEIVFLDREALAIELRAAATLISNMQRLVDPSCARVVISDRPRRAQRSVG